MIPGNFTFSATLDRLPLKGAAARMRSEAVADLDGSASPLAFMNGLMEEVGTARPRFRLGRLELASEDVQLSGEGEVAFDPVSAVMMSAVVYVRGLGNDLKDGRLGYRLAERDPLADDRAAGAPTASRAMPPSAKGRPEGRPSR